jgi:hypothetical protein
MGGGADRPSLQTANDIESCREATVEGESTPLNFRRETTPCYRRSAALRRRQSTASTPAAGILIRRPPAQALWRRLEHRAGGDGRPVGCHYSPAGPLASLLPQGHRAPGGSRGSIGQGRTRHRGVGSEVRGPGSVWRVFPQECADGRRSRRSACVRVAGFSVGIPDLQQARPVASLSASAEMSADANPESLL